MKKLIHQVDEVVYLQLSLENQ